MSEVLQAILYRDFLSDQLKINKLVRERIKQLENRITQLETQINDSSH